MGHHHSHHHDHGVHHELPDSQRMLALSIALNVVFVAVEVGFGVAVGSLALLADAGHNFSDVLGLVLAWGAVLLARRRPTARFTYGYRKATVMAALASSLLLMIALGSMAWEAIRRFQSPPETAGMTIIVVAAVGVVINTLSAHLLMRGSQGDLNLRAAFLHMAIDAGVSVGVVIGGALILWTGMYWIDPAISLLIVAIVFWGTWSLLRDSAKLSIDAAPANIDVEEVRRFILDRPGVTEIHDLHVWAMSTTETALTAHLVMPAGNEADTFLHELAATLKHDFAIQHVTIQIERGDVACSLAGDDQV